MKPVNQGLSPYSRILSQKMLLEKVETSKFNNPRNMLRVRVGNNNFIERPSQLYTHWNNIVTFM